MNPNLFLILPLLLFSVVCHEVAHGFIALKCGDDTAKIAGRITLNPLPHIDPIGTILVPLFLSLSGANFFIAWAKPVPVNPRRFLNYKMDHLKVAIAGPIANILLAILSSIILFITIKILKLNINPSIISLFVTFGYINIMLALFNLIPIPPLDGSSLMYGLLPTDLADSYRSLERYGFIIIIILINLPIFRNLFIGLISLLVNLLYGGIFI